MYKVPRKLCAVSGNTAAFSRIFTGKNDIQVGALRALLNPSTVLAEVVFAGKLVPVPGGPGEEQITEGLTARSFLIKAIFASSPAVVGLDISVAVYIN